MPFWLTASQRCCTLRRAISTSGFLGADADNDELVKVGFVGAGGVSFGTKEGPWNHSVRLERMPDVKFTAIIDPDLALAKVRHGLHVLSRFP